MKYITRTVWILSLVSLFTDTASEMLYPVMPLYLKSIGFSIVLIGVLEGFAEATAGLSKGYFGKLSDIKAKRVPFVQLGYALSALSRPMLAIFSFPVWVFAARTLDKVGKGIRTGARDAILSSETTSSSKAKVFGFHRSMDTFGAVLGPALALLYLYFYPEQYKTLFFIALIPGLLALLTSFFLKEKNIEANETKNRLTFFSFLRYWKQSPAAYRKLLVGLLFFTLFNSSDVFLLLKAKEIGMNDSLLIGNYIFYNLIYALFAFPMGILADKLGLKMIFTVGLVFFALVYVGMSLTQNTYVIFAMFFLYGLFSASTEGVSKAWISNISDTKDTATAIGTYAAFQSTCTMFASSLTGFIWFKYGSSAALLLTAAMTAITVIYFLIVIRNK